MSVGFSQSFPIELSIISRALRAHVANPHMTKGEIAAEIGLNKPKMDGTSAWLRYFELWQHRKGALLIGQMLLKYDEHFSLLGTKWVMHHTLASNPSAEVWYFGFNSYFRIGSHFTREELQTTLLNQGIGTDTKYLTTDVGILINSYTVHQDAFQEISMFNVDESSLYIPRSPNSVPPIVIAYALYKWRENSKGVSTIALSRLHDDEGQVARIFMLSHQQLMNVLYELESLGIIRITKSADLDNIAFTYGGTAMDLLERYYNEVS